MIQLTKIDHLVSLNEFARMNGVKLDALYRRMKRHTISTITIDGVKFVDINTSHIGKHIDKRVKATLPQATLPNDINPNNLKIIKKYADKHKFRAYRIYDKILLGKVKGVIISDIVFFDISTLNEH